jgi:hypothetical protein
MLSRETHIRSTTSELHSLMRLRVLQAGFFPDLSEAPIGISGVQVGKLSHFLDPGDVMLVYHPNTDFSECRCIRACEVTSSDPEQGTIIVDTRVIDVVVKPDRHARHYWRDRPYLCPDVKKTIKYRLLSIFEEAFEDTSWSDRKLDDAVNFVFQPDLTRPTLTPQQGDIYLLKGSMLYKIGKSIHTEKRKKRIEKQVGEQLELLHTITSNDYTRAEVTLHKRYEHCHRHGEWFKLGPEEVTEILQIREMNF